MGFEINDFLNASLTEPIAQTAPQVPAGRWLARIADLEGGGGVETWVKPPSGAAISPRLDVPFVIVDEQVQREMGRTKPPMMTQGYFLNIDSATQRIDPKNNAAFGQLCAALKISGGSNGELFSQLPGAGPLYVTVAPDRKADKDGNYRMRITKTEPAA